MAVALLVVLFLAAFLLGSIPWGVILSRCVYKKDIRDCGSGNIGATNAVRAMGAKGGAATFALDVLKGVAAGALAWFAFAPLLSGPFLADTMPLMVSIYGSGQAAADAVSSGQVRVLAAGVSFIGCVFGHIFSPWLKFHGGKGISVAFGCEFFAITPLGALLDLAVFLIFAVTTRYVSLGSVMAAVACIGIGIWKCWNCWPAAIMVVVSACVVIWAHRGNIGRLVRGEESKFGQKRD